MTNEEREELRKTADKGYKAKAAKEVVHEILIQRFKDLSYRLASEDNLTPQKAFEIALEMQVITRIEARIEYAINEGRLAQEELIENGE